MKKFLLFFVILISLPLVAQDDNNAPLTVAGRTMTRVEWRRQMHAQKLVFYAEKMELTEVERVAFESLFSEFDQSMHASFAKVREAKRSLNDSSVAADYDEVVKVMNDQAKVQAGLRYDFINSLVEVVSAEKTYKFLMAEKEFKNLLIRDIEKYRRAPKK